MISVIGAGKVGATTAAFLMMGEADRKIVLVDIVEGLPQGEALDMNHAAAIMGKSVTVIGSNNYEDIKGSDIVIITAIVIITTNPLDAMVTVLYNRLKFPRNRVIGFSVVLDSRRMAYYASKYIGISPSSIIPLVLGQHGENMYPVPELSSVYGKSLKNFLTEEQYNSVVKNTIEAGAQITNLRKFSSNWGPAAGLLVMVDAIKNDRKTVVEASVYLDGEYSTKGIFAQVPVVLGKNGVEKIVEVDLLEEQKEKFIKSIDAIKSNLKQVPPQYLS